MSGGSADGGRGGEESPSDAAADCEFVRLGGGDPEHVTTVVLDRPDARNALNGRLRGELQRVLAAVEDSDARVVVLTGSDDAGAFVAGADVAELRERSALEQRRASERPRVYEAVADLRQPVVARVNGHALGGGLELALACDVRVAHERAKLGSPEIDLGLVPGGGATQRLPRLVGEGQAMRLVLSGDLVDAEEAADIGLVESVHGDDGFDDAVYGLAASMAEHSPVALEFGKDAVRAAGRMDLDDGLEYEAELFAQLFATADSEEGMAAFFEDREPEWRGE
ncbi:enoyl-CoA hydratase/isomerase family protein [Halobacterium yunchengense]|uniref:enoyl-CoA hydratase/isomerase family protein n=1 Tax=Halobacterium yunchengense TaxID=3108497 RepID=UPI00300BF53F